MNKSIISFLLLITAFFIATTSYTQNEPKKFTTEKKVYIDNNGTIYVQKSLPLYLKFSTSKDEGATTYNLKSEKDGDALYLDTEGINFIRSKWALDPVTKKYVYPQREISFPVYADGISPLTKISFLDAPKYISVNNKIYYGSGLKISLDSKDAVSGVDKTYIAIAGTYNEYKENIGVNDENEYLIYYYATDKVGNMEVTKSNNFIVDLTAPKTTKEIVGIYYNGNILSPSTQIKLTSNDELSGVKSTNYSFDSGIKNIYNSYPININYLTDGEHKITYNSIDKVLNEEKEIVFDFYLDKTPPIVNVAIEGDLYEGKYKFISSRTKINMTATDNKAGVENIIYSIDFKQEGSYTSKFNLSESEGLHTISYYGIDNVKNKSQKQSLNVFMDLTSPKTYINYSNPQFFARDTLFINNKTQISLKSKDDEAGVSKTEYYINEGTKIEYNAPFIIEKEGFNKIKFYSTDKVDNIEQTKESFVYIDNNPPVIYNNFSIQPIDKKSKNGTEYNVYPNYTRLYLGATDKHCGTSKIVYSMDGGKTWTEYSSPHTLDVSELSLFKSKKFYSVIVKTEDKLGNNSEETIEFFVDKD